MTKCFGSVFYRIRIIFCTHFFGHFAPYYAPLLLPQETCSRVVYCKRKYIFAVELSLAYV